MGKMIFKAAMYTIWLAGIALMWAAYGLRAAAMSWLLASSFATAILLEGKSDD